MDTTTINPSPPDLAGLTWRPMTPNDLDALVELAREILRVDGGLSFLFEPGSLKSRYFAEASGAGISAFSPDGRMVASAAVYLSGEADKQRAVIVGQVWPEMRNRGIGTYLLHWGQVQVKSRLAAAVSPLKLQISTESLTELAHRLYLSQGYERVFDELVMACSLTQPLPEAPFPPDVGILTWQPDLVEQFYQAYHDAFRERPGFPGWSMAEWVEHETDEDTIAEWTLLARVGDEPVGFVLGAIDQTTQPPSGFITQIGVVPAQRRRGLASALLVETMRRMQAAGAVLAQLTVHTNNPGAIEAYTRLGFNPIGRRARYERGIDP